MLLFTFTDGLKQETLSQLSTQKKKKGKGKEHNYASKEGIPCFF